ncbi:hypothetical protein HG452_002655 [Candidatus Saccharibacteria bacterium]|nr:hypothetical protein [Candidatus Saccharibacteria bacterium]
MVIKALRLISLISLIFGIFGLSKNIFSIYDSYKVLIIAMALILFVVSVFLLSKKFSKKALLVFFIFIALISQIITGFSTASTQHSWDAGAIQTIANNYIKTGNTDPNNNAWEYNYLLRYDNNITITYFVVIIYRIANFVGIDKDILLIFINNILILLSSLFIMAIIYVKFNKSVFSIISTFIIAIINFSPYSTVFYTDTVGLFFVASQLFILLLIERYAKRNNVYVLKILTILLGIFAYLGYAVKPTTLILMISILLSSLFFINKCRNVKIIAKYFGLFAFGAVSSFFILNTLIVSSNGFAKYSSSQIREKRTGFLHYLGMGSMRGLPPYSECNTGPYCPRYADDTASKGAREREEVSLNIFIDSLTNNFPFGWLKFAILKISNFFNDGTFGVWGEGSSRNNFIQFLAEGNIVHKFRRFLSWNGDKFRLFSVFVSIVWGAILTLFTIFIFKSANKFKYYHVVLLFFTLLVVTYQVLFESRARYIFIYLPIFIVGAAFGLNFILEMCNGRNEKR